MPYRQDHIQCFRKAFDVYRIKVVNYGNKKEEVQWQEKSSGINIGPKKGWNIQPSFYHWRSVTEDGIKSVTR